MTAAGADAVAGFDDVMAGYLGFRADVGDRLKAALARDPECPLLLCARGYFTLLLSTRRLVGRAREALAAAEAAAAAHGATARERAHIEALRAWTDGDVEAALRRWMAILAEHPRDVLALKLAQFWQFYLGDSRTMLRTVDQVMPAWTGVAGHGYVLGLQAFGLEECGDLAAAERVGRRAVEINPADVWAIHAVAHAHEMRDAPEEGIAWLDGLTPHFAGCNNFRFHLWWHRCLFHLELGDTGTVMRLYDGEVRAESTGDYLDICNAASLLWRLEDLGVDVGDRWRELARHAAARIGDHMLAFAEAHFMMALAAADAAGGERLLTALRVYATTGETEARAMAEVGLAVCDAVLALRQGRPGRAIELLGPLRHAFVRIGGSHAQRDLFDKMLIAACRADGRMDAARDLLADRLRRRPANRWARQTLAQMS